MNFEYLIKIKKEDSIDIENVGNCAIDVFNDMGFEWILLISTDEGITEILEYGPIVPDIEKLPNSVSYTYDRINYSQSKISTRIDKFLNAGYRMITQASEISKEEAKEKMRNLVSYVCW